MEDPRPQPATITVQKNGLSKVHTSDKTYLYPMHNEVGLTLKAKRRDCMQRLVEVQSNPVYVLTLRSMADTLDSVMMNHAFSLSEVGRFPHHCRHKIHSQLLERQAAVDAGV